MIMNPEEVLRASFGNLVQRKVSKELMQDFIDRSRRYHADSAELQAVLDELEKKIPEGE